jgi:hypothetical protein
MNETLQSILNDLYELDPELKKSEKDLIPLLEKLAESKPDLNLDENFVTNLRNQLMVHADEMMATERPTQAGWFSRFLAPLMGGTMALAALMIGLMVWNGQLGVKPKPEAAPAIAPMMARSLTVRNTGETADDRVQAPEEPKALSDGTQETTEPIGSTVAEPAPMMFQAVPAEDSAGTTIPAPEAAPMASRKMSPDSVEGQATNRKTFITLAFEKVQAGEGKITADSGSLGVRSAKNILAIDLNNLPEAFIEVPSILPEGYRSFEDQMPTWSDGAPQYYIYSEKEGQWHGPF